MRRKLKAVLFAAFLAMALAGVASAGGPPIGSGGPNIQSVDGPPIGSGGPVIDVVYGPPIGSG